MDELHGAADRIAIPVVFGEAAPLHRRIIPNHHSLSAISS
jgi:hypothetical protein